MSIQELKLNIIEKFLIHALARESLTKNTKEIYEILLQTIRMPEEGINELYIALAALESLPIKMESKNA